MTTKKTTTKTVAAEEKEERNVTSKTKSSIPYVSSKEISNKRQKKDHTFMHESDDSSNLSYKLFPPTTLSIPEILSNDNNISLNCSINKNTDRFNLELNEVGQSTFSISQHKEMIIQPLTPVNKRKRIEVHENYDTTGGYPPELCMAPKRNRKKRHRIIRSRSTINRNDNSFTRGGLFKHLNFNDDDDDNDDNDDNILNIMLEPDAETNDLGLF